MILKSLTMCQYFNLVIVNGCIRITDLLSSQLETAILDHNRRTNEESAQVHLVEALYFTGNYSVLC